MAEVGHHVFVSNTTTSTTSTTVTTAHTLGTLTTELVGGGDYLLILSAIVGTDSGTQNNNRNFVVRDNGVALAGTEGRYEPLVQSDGYGHPYSFAKRFTKNASGNVTLDYYNPDAAQTTVQSVEAIFIRLDDLTENTDFFYSESATGDTNVGTYTDGESFTMPAGVEPWLVFAWCQWECDTVDEAHRLRIVDDTTNLAEVTHIAQDVQDDTVIMTSYPVMGGASTKTVKLQYDSAGTGDILYDAIAAIRLGAFKHGMVEFGGTTTVTAADSWVEAESLTSFTCNHTGNHCMMGSAIFTAANDANGRERKITSQIGAASEVDQTGSATRQIVGDATGDLVPALTMGEASFTDGDALNFDLDVGDDTNTTNESVGSSWLAAFTWEKAVTGTTTKIEGTYGQFGSDAAEFNIQLTDEDRYPTGVILFATQCSTINAEALDNVVSVGFSDFTTSTVCAASDEDAVTPTDGSRAHHDSSTTLDVIRVLSPGSTTFTRTAQVYPIPGGVRVIPGESGTDHIVMAVFSFGTPCHVFSSDGDGTLSIDETFAITHGFSRAPKAGMYMCSFEDNSTTTFSFQMSLGFHAYDDATITQAAMAWGYDSAVNTSACNSRHSTSRVCSVINATNGNEVEGCELTALNATTCTYTNRVGEAVDKYCGILFECDDLSAEVANITHPTDAGVDWNVNDFTITPQTALVILTRQQSINNNETDGDAGVGGLVCMNADGSNISASWASQDARDTTASNSNTESQINNDFFGHTHAGGTHVQLNNHTFTSDGWDVTDANITTATPGTRYWPVLVFGTATAGVNTDIAVPTGPLR